MALYRTLTVVDVMESHRDIQKLRLSDDSRAYSFTQTTGTVEIGDEVIVNTTAVDLNLGTGGWHFVLWNKSKQDLETHRGGHIMKMRYTPYQLDTGAAEEFDSYPKQEKSVEGMNVIAAPLHSQIPAIAAYIKSKNKDLKIAVLISDGAALPLALSDLVRNMREATLIDSTVTFGHAFGGDIEAINVYTSLISAKHILNADIAVVSMGPGIVGSDSVLGFTGIEVGHHLDAAKSLNAHTYGVLRCSQAEPRERHRGVSHHSLTTYSMATAHRHTLGLISDSELSDTMKKQLEHADIHKKHDVIEVESVGIVDLMEEYGLSVTSMGRPAKDDELFFESAAAAAQLAYNEIGN